MDVEITKGIERDQIDVRRSNGTRASIGFPVKGRAPHDAIHLVVELELEYRNAFWGRVASGAEPAEVANLAKSGGHSSSSRASNPKPEIIELLWAERLVECFEAELWSKPSEILTFRGVLEAACTQSKISTPTLSDENIRSIRLKLDQMLRQWQSLDTGQSIVLIWNQETTAKNSN